MPRNGVARSPKDRVDTDRYMRPLSFYNNIALDWGMRSARETKTMLSTQYRGHGQVKASWPADASGVPHAARRSGPRLPAQCLEGDTDAAGGRLSMATGIKVKVVILGMGCSNFGERWDADAADLMADSFEEALMDAGIERSQIDAG